MMKIGPAVAAAAVFAIASPVCAQDAVQWRVEDGGNGHWYRFEPDSVDWPVAQGIAESLGGHLVTLTSASEYDFIRSALALHASYFWMGGRNSSGSCGSSCEWGWVTGESWSYTNWNPGEPNNAGGNEHWLECYPNGGWNDRYPGALQSVYEWSADCNSDGIVDYGQIRDGTFPDVNANGVPDCCEPGESCTPCPGDVTNGGTVDAADLSILLAAWGTNGQGEFDTDLNSDGLVDGGDLALVLGGWGACP
jgi:hypothetical protein